MDTLQKSKRKKLKHIVSSITDFTTYCLQKKINKVKGTNLQTVKSSGGYLACYCSCRQALFDKGKMCTGYLLNDRHQQHRSEKG